MGIGGLTPLEEKVAAKLQGPTAGKARPQET